MLRATTARNCSSLIWPDGSAPAALASLLFDPPEPQNIGKTVSRDFSTFSRACIFFLLTLSLLWSSFFCSSLNWLLPPLLFHLSILSEVWLFLLHPPLHGVPAKKDLLFDEGSNLIGVFFHELTCAMSGHLQKPLLWLWLQQPWQTPGKNLAQS